MGPCEYPGSSGCASYNQISIPDTNPIVSDSERPFPALLPYPPWEILSNLLLSQGSEAQPKPFAGPWTTCGGRMKLHGHARSDLPAVYKDQSQALDRSSKSNRGTDGPIKRINGSYQIREADMRARLRWGRGFGGLEWLGADVDADCARARL